MKSTRGSGGGMGRMRVKNAERMMTYVTSTSKGIEVSFADGCSGLIPFGDLPEVGGLGNLAEIELPNPYRILLRTTPGETVELPWDFARHYCDASYRPRVEAVGARGAQAIATRIRQMREDAGMTQVQLATSASIARVTLVRIENGQQSPRYETLVAVAAALRRPMADVVSPKVPS